MEPKAKKCKNSKSPPAVIDVVEADNNNDVDIENCQPTDLSQQPRSEISREHDQASTNEDRYSCELRVDDDESFEKTVDESQDHPSDSEEDMLSTAESAAAKAFSGSNNSAKSSHRHRHQHHYLYHQKHQQPPSEVSQQAGVTSPKQATRPSFLITDILGPRASATGAGGGGGGGQEPSSSPVHTFIHSHTHPFPSPTAHGLRLPGGGEIHHPYPLRPSCGEHLSLPLDDDRMDDDKMDASSSEQADDDTGSGNYTGISYS